MSFRHPSVDETFYEEASATSPGKRHRTTQWSRPFENNTNRQKPIRPVFVPGPAEVEPITAEQATQHARWKAARQRLMSHRPLVPPPAVIEPEVVALPEPEPVPQVFGLCVRVPQWAAPKVEALPGVSPIGTIQRVVSFVFGITVPQQCGEARHRPVARARQAAMFLAYEVGIWSLPQIARRFGDRDHTTVLHSVRKVRELLTADTDFAAKVDEVRALLRATSSVETWLEEMGRGLAPTVSERRAA